MVIEAFACIATVASAAAACVALWISEKATQAAEASTEAAKTVARIEAARRHEELAPRYEIKHAPADMPYWLELHNLTWRRYVVRTTTVFTDGKQARPEEVEMPPQGFGTVIRPSTGRRGARAVERGLDPDIKDVRLTLEFKLADGEDPCECGRSPDFGHWHDMSRQIPRRTRVHSRRVRRR
ncbi:hypothetical protein [Phytohabitans houttuyneae]|uniref:Uncharacterized protein n=1 Tax=Phytohabitans houttuyneae TaxID=1076126 RepID=A0A6V8KBR2_9ACTN|nr:hypothetical protein [Phytohabitans houttuyneae]GFJ79416.1 hypothetical protein Phou_035960 [Phytohabitans houttuyneae]